MLRHVKDIINTKLPCFYTDVIIHMKRIIKYFLLLFVFIYIFQYYLNIKENVKILLYIKFSSRYQIRLNIVI